MSDPLSSLSHEIFSCGVVAFGGLATVLSALHNGMVHDLGLVSDDEFNSTYALATAAPGPNSLFLALLGYKVAGPAGLMVAMLSWSLATLTLLMVVGRLGSLPGLRAFRNALLPCVLGLLVSGALTTAHAFGQAVPQSVMCVLVLGAMLRFPKVNPAVFVLGAGLLGAFLLS